MLDSGIFTSTSGSVNGNGVFVGNKAKSASFLAEIFYRLLGNGISMSPTSSFLVLPKTGLTVTVKNGWGVKKGYPYKLAADLDITLNSSTSEQVIYIGVRLVASEYGYSGYANDDVSAFTTFVADTDTIFARIDIPANAVTITDAMITDLRYNTAYCGFVDEFRLSLQTLAADLSNLIQTIYAENGISASDIGTDTVLYFTNQAVPTSGWAAFTASGAEETALQAAGYTYRKALELTGVTASMKVRVDPSIDIESCGTTIWRENQAYTGGIYLYAKAAPTNAFTLLTIEARGVS